MQKGYLSDLMIKQPKNKKLKKKKLKKSLYLTPVTILVPKKFKLLPKNPTKLKLKPPKKLQKKLNLLILLILNLKPPQPKNPLLKKLPKKLNPLLMTLLPKKKPPKKQQKKLPKKLNPLLMTLLPKKKPPKKQQKKLLPKKLNLLMMTLLLKKKPPKKQLPKKLPPKKPNLLMMTLLPKKKLPKKQQLKKLPKKLNLLTMNLLKKKPPKKLPPKNNLWKLNNLKKPQLNQNKIMENGKLLQEVYLMMLMKTISETGSKKKEPPQKLQNYQEIEKPKDPEVWLSQFSKPWKDYKLLSIQLVLNIWEELYILITLLTPEIIKDNNLLETLLNLPPENLKLSSLETYLIILKKKPQKNSLLIVEPQQEPELLNKTENLEVLVMLILKLKKLLKPLQKKQVKIQKEDPLKLMLLNKELEEETEVEIEEEEVEEVEEVDLEVYNFLPTIKPPKKEVLLLSKELKKLYEKITQIYNNKNNLSSDLKPYQLQH